MFDAPCGDFNWMRAVDFPENFAYIGGEIVPFVDRDEPVRSTRAPGGDFSPLDITADPFPDADLWFCRDCLFHLPTESVLDALRLFAKSRISYVMTTTHLNATKFDNRDIAPGGYRKLDSVCRSVSAAPRCALPHPRLRVSLSAARALRLDARASG